MGQVRWCSLTSTRASLSGGQLRVNGSGQVVLLNVNACFTQRRTDDTSAGDVIHVDS
jgi:hypothetical protein